MNTHDRPIFAPGISPPLALLCRVTGCSFRNSAASDKESVSFASLLSVLAGGGVVGMNSATLPASGAGAKGVREPGVAPTSDEPDPLGLPTQPARLLPATIGLPARHAYTQNLQALSSQTWSRADAYIIRKVGRKLSE